MLYALKIYPFGDKAYLWADADQYFGIESYFGSLLEKMIFFIPGAMLLGGNAFGISLLFLQPLQRNLYPFS